MNIPKPSVEELEFRIKQLEELVKQYEHISNTSELETHLEHQITEKMFKTHIQSISEGIYATLNGGKFVYVNKAMSSIFGYSKEEFLQMNAWMLAKDELREKTKQLFIEKIKNKDHSFIVVECKNKKGNSIFCEINITFIEENQFIYGIVRDITETFHAKINFKYSEQKYQKLYKSLMDGYVIVDMNGVIQEYNQPYLNMLGYNEHEIHLLTYNDLTPEKWHEFENKIVQEQILINGFSDVYEKEYIKKNGETFPVELRTFLLQNEKGENEGMWAIVRDITERKKNEFALSKSEEKFRNLIENAVDGIFHGDSKGNFIGVNLIGCLMTGYSREELLTMNMRDLFTDDVLTSSPLRYDLLIQGKTVRNERLLLRKDKTFLPIEMNTKRLNDATYQSFFRDISERKKMENDLKENEELLRTLINSMPDIVCFKDGEGRWLEANDFILELFNLKIVDYRGKKDSELAEYTPFFKKVLSNSEISDRKVWENRKKIRFDETIELENGDKQVFDIIKVPTFKENGERKGLLVIGRDITERKKTEKELHRRETELQKQNENYMAINKELIAAKEKAEESDMLKSAFLANMSHEIRTPMNAILGFAQLLESQDVSNEERNKFLQYIENKGQDLLNIINDILDISKIEANQIRLHYTSYDLFSLLEEVYSNFNTKNELLNFSQVELICNCSEVPQKNVIISDFDRIKQVLTNLISNSLKFTENGIIEFGCKLYHETELLFYVKDSGIGIAENKLSVIFDRFRQADENLISRKYGGTGLGLSISKGLVELMKGKIWAESVLDSGSTFFFTIPYNPDKNCKIHKCCETNLKYNWEDKLFLIVEDDRLNREFLSEIVADTKANYLLASDATTTMDIILNTLDIDLVLLDIRLPDFDGLELTKRIKKERPQTKIIAQTAYASDSDKQKCFDAGCDDFIAKPISKKVLLSKINNCFNHNIKDE